MIILIFNIPPGTYDFFCSKILWAIASPNLGLEDSLEEPLRLDRLAVVDGAMAEMKNDLVSSLAGVLCR